MIQFDYGFLGLGEEGSGHLVPMVIGKDRRSGYLGGGVVVRKGDHFYSVWVIDEFFDELGYVSMEVQSDGEPALVSLLRQAFAARVKRVGAEAAATQIRLRLSPEESHASQGSAESGIKSVAGLTRTARLALERRFNIKILSLIHI